jgi:MFS family permease
MRDTSVAQMFKGTLPQLIAVITGTVSAISDGMQYGWSAPLIPVLQSPDSPVKITESDAVWLESIYMIGGMAGLPITIYFVDRIGRQKNNNRRLHHESNSLDHHRRGKFCGIFTAREILNGFSR